MSGTVSRPSRRTGHVIASPTVWNTARNVTAALPLGPGPEQWYSSAAWSGFLTLEKTPCMLKVRCEELASASVIIIAIVFGLAVYFVYGRRVSPYVRELDHKVFASSHSPDDQVG